MALTKETCLGKLTDFFKAGRISIFNHHITNWLRLARLPVDITLFGCRHINILSTLDITKYNVVDQHIFQDRILC